MMRSQQSPTRFLLSFGLLFGLFYSFNLFYIGITTPGGWYSPFLDQHLNYISSWREFNILGTAKALRLWGYTVCTTATTLKVQGHSGFRLVYSCLGYGVMSFFAAFTLSFPKQLKSRLLFLAAGITGIQILNTLRLILIAVFYKPDNSFPIDHHNIFNILLYAILFSAICLWLKPKKQTGYSNFPSLFSN